MVMTGIFHTDENILLLILSEAGYELIEALEIIIDFRRFTEDFAVFFLD
jgi:hypothetical protein